MDSSTRVGIGKSVTKSSSVVRMTHSFFLWLFFLWLITPEDMTCLNEQLKGAFQEHFHQHFRQWSCKDVLPRPKNGLQQCCRHCQQFLTMKSCYGKARSLFMGIAQLSTCEGKEKKKVAIECASQQTSKLLQTCEAASVWADLPTTTLKENFNRT